MNHRSSKISVHITLNIIRFIYVSHTVNSYHFFIYNMHPERLGSYFARKLATVAWPHRRKFGKSFDGFEDNLAQNNNSSVYYLLFMPAHDLIVQMSL